MLAVIFVLARLGPGDPAIANLGDQATEESLQALRQQLGLDRPLHEQYVVFLGQVLSGDLGRSMSSGRTVLEEVWQVLPYTLELTAPALLIGPLFGLPLGPWAALRRTAWPDSAGRPIDRQSLVQ